MTPTETTIVQVGLWAAGFLGGWAARHQRESRWNYSVRMKDGTRPVPVRQTRERPPNERYQEWYASFGWIDVPYAERGPWYHEHYPLPPQVDSCGPETP